MRRLISSMALAGISAVTGAAHAGVISEDLSFTLGGFLDITAGSNIAPPITAITGYITVTYDPSLSYDNDTADIVVHSLTGITVGSPLGFTYGKNAAGQGFLEFGGIANDASLVYGNTTISSSRSTSPIRTTRSSRRARRPAIPAGNTPAIRRSMPRATRWPATAPAGSMAHRRAS